jgi:hypothetical protein
MSIIAQLLRTPRNAALFFIGLFVVCLLCQAYPATAAAHHTDSSSHRVCATVAEAVVISPVDRLVGSFATAGLSHSSVVLSPFLPVLWGGATRTGSMALQPDGLPNRNPPALYCLNCTYRL